MRVLLAVIHDLYTFACSFLQRSVTVPKTVEAHTVPALAARPALTQLAAPDALPVLPVAGVLPTHASPQTVSQLVVAVGRAFLHRDPTEAFDNVEAELPYATAVVEVRRSGRWVLVEVRGQTGWVLSDQLAYEADILPQFRLGHIYDAQSPETEKLRAYIGDSFHGGKALLPLCDVEYVTYRLKRAGRSVPWPQSYNRIAGTWQRKLRGCRGVRIEVMPHTGAVMEYIIDDVGYVGYVEKVSPDLKITVSGVGLTHESQYTEQVLTHSLWRELRPVFIQLT